VAEILSNLNPPPKPTTPQNAPWTEAENTRGLLQQILANIQALVAASGGQPVTLNVPVAVGGQGLTSVSIVTPHKKYFISGSYSVTLPGTPVSLPSQAIPDGYPVTIVAFPTNTGNIRWANDQNKVLIAQWQFNGLAPGLGVSLKIQDLSCIWMDADNPGEGVSWIFESDVKQ
jgi:hypothetical protein